MATVHSQVNGFDPSLEDLPAWKRDLILRRRANARIHGGLAARSGGRSAPHSPTTTNPLEQNFLRSIQGTTSQLSLSSVQGSRESLYTLQGPRDSLCSLHGLRESLCSVCGHNYNTNQFNSRRLVDKSVSRLDSVNTVSGVKGCDSVVDNGYSAVSQDCGGMRGPSTMHHKGVKAPEGWHYNEDEDLEYGPGIVSRLKNRYMSLALREAKGRASLRKYSSLEDLLDDGVQERGRSSQKDRPSSGTSNFRKESMKRTRSMDSLTYRRTDSTDRVPKSHSSGALRQALVKEDIIIIEAPPRPTENGGPAFKPDSLLKKKTLEGEELPPGDRPIVKQVKQIFEASSGKAPRGTAAKVAAYKAAQHAKKQHVGGVTPPVKPPLKAKPTQLQTKKPLSPTIESVRSSLKQVQPKVHPSPRSTLGVKAPVPAQSPPGRHIPLSSVTSGLTPITASVTFPQVNGEEVKTSSKLSHKEPLDAAPVGIIPRPHSPPSPVGIPRPHSPPTPLPPSPTPTHKVSIPSAFKGDPNNTKENQRVLQENRKNVEKSSRPFGEVQPKVPPSAPPSGPSPRSPPLKLLMGTSSPSPPKTSPVQEMSKVSVPSVSESPPPTRESPTFVSSPPSGVETPSEPSSVSKNQQSSSSIMSPSVLEVVRAAEAKSPSTDSPSVGGLKPTRQKESGGRRPPVENSSLVFNFSKRTDTPDYIENDGVDLSKRQFSYKHESGYVIMPGYDGKNDSSTDGDDDGFEDGTDAPRLGVPPPPCNISFEGEGVIIKGRSNLQRQPRGKKLEVSFDMPSTSTFEYPSENFLILEFDNDRSSSSPITSPTVPGGPTMGSTGGLASYTPSKLALTDSFELGISRSSAPHPPTPPKGREPLEKLLHLQDHVRPADENETVTWSAESAPDMLF